MGEAKGLRRLFIVTTVTFIACALNVRAQDIDLDTDDIGGIVSSENGLEAGVWVIAETYDFQTLINSLIKNARVDKR